MEPSCDHEVKVLGIALLPDANRQEGARPSLVINSSRRAYEAHG